MKKCSILVFLCCILVVSLAMPVWASGAELVADEADILTDAEEQRLHNMARDISDRYGCGVYIVTVWDYRSFGNTVRQAAESYFTANGCGLGTDANGVMLFLSMAERDYALIAHGNVANTAFTDYGKDELADEFLDDFRDDDWFGGFRDYVTGCAEYLEAAASGNPIDVQQGGGTALTVVMVLVIPAVVAGAVCASMVSSMKSVAQKATANDYILRSSIQIAQQHERFINQTVVRQVIESSSHSSGGTTVNSGGFSGRSGKF